MNTAEKTAKTGRCDEYIVMIASLLHDTDDIKIFGTKNYENARIYTEKGNHKRLSDIEMFTFEPHSSIPNSKYEYKREDIYYFNNGRLIKL